MNDVNEAVTSVAPTLSISPERAQRRQATGLSLPTAAMLACGSTTGIGVTALCAVGFAQIPWWMGALATGLTGIGATFWLVGWIKKTWLADIHQLSRRLDHVDDASTNTPIHAIELQNLDAGIQFLQQSIALLKKLELYSVEQAKSLHHVAESIRLAQRGQLQTALSALSALSSKNALAITDEASPLVMRQHLAETDLRQALDGFLRSWQEQVLRLEGVGRQLDAAASLLPELLLSSAVSSSAHPQIDTISAAHPQNTAHNHDAALKTGLDTEKAAVLQNHIDDVEKRIQAFKPLPNLLADVSQRLTLFARLPDGDARWRTELDKLSEALRNRAKSATALVDSLDKGAQQLREQVTLLSSIPSDAAPSTQNAALHTVLHTTPHDSMRATLSDATEPTPILSTELSAPNLAERLKPLPPTWQEARHALSQYLDGLHVERSLASTVSAQKDLPTHVIMDTLHHNKSE